MLTSVDPDQDLHHNILAAASLFFLAFPISFPIHSTCRHHHPCEAGEHPPHTASFQYFFSFLPPRKLHCTDFEFANESGKIQPYHRHSCLSNASVFRMNRMPGLPGAALKPVDCYLLPVFVRLARNQGCGD